MKKIIAACIDRVIEFDDPGELKDYLDGLKNRGRKFRILWETHEGKHKIRILEQYNNSPMIED